MGLGSCYTCIKYLMFAFNFLFWLLGMAILAIGIWVRVDPNFSQFMDQTVSSNPTYVAAYLFIAIGCIVVVIGFFGCCGAIRESQCLLGLFFISLFIIFCVLLGAGIYCVVQKDSIKGVVGDFLQESVNNYETRQEAKDAMDKIQKDLECCGSSQGVDDYPITGKIPSSCKTENYKRPCVDELFSKLSSHLIIVAGVAIGVALIMILGMIFSMVLCCAIRDVKDAHEVWGSSLYYSMSKLRGMLECCGSKTGSGDYPIDVGVPSTCTPQNYQRPCVDELFKQLSSHLIIVAGVAIGVALIMILGMIFSMVLCCAIRDVNA